MPDRRAKTTIRRLKDAPPLVRMPTWMIRPDQLERIRKLAGENNQPVAHVFRHLLDRALDE